VLADEPTGNLDSVSSAHVMRILRELVSESGQTVVLVTHDKDVAAQADRVVHVRDGRIEAEVKAPAVSRRPFATIAKEA
jgi:ABC-type lipoprotein export system ATPase subunit